MEEGVKSLTTEYNGEMQLLLISNINPTNQKTHPTNLSKCRHNQT